MSTEPPLKAGTSKHRTFFEKLSGVFHTPTREDFIDTLHEANEQKLIDDSALILSTRSTKPTNKNSLTIPP